MPAAAAHQPVLAEGVLQSGASWLDSPSAHVQVCMLLVLWACNSDVHEAAEGLCVDAVVLTKLELPKT